jgi:hypothetical protein
VLLLSTAVIHFRLSNDSCKVIMSYTVITFLHLCTEFAVKVCLGLSLDPWHRPCNFLALALTSASVSWPQPRPLWPH